MKKLQKVSSLIAAVALVATPTMAFAEQGSGSERPDDRARVESNVRIKFGEFFGTENRGKGKAEDRATTTPRVKVDGALEARIDKLTKLEDRIDDMSRLTPEQKASLTSVINAQLNSLTTIKARLESNATTTKEDKLELAKSNRIASLVMPQVAISAASNRILFTVAQMEAFAPKLQARIASSSAAGVDVTAANTAYANMTAKLASARTEAQAAASMTVALKADNGDQAVYKANQQALKDARAKLKAAETDLKAARKDITTILRALNVKASASATVTP